MLTPLRRSLAFANSTIIVETSGSIWQLGQPDGFKKSKAPDRFGDGSGAWGRVPSGANLKSPP